MTKSSRLLIVVLVLACLSPAWTQTSTGSLNGTVADPDGSFVPGAKISARHEPTGREFQTLTSDAGVFLFPGLEVGPYTLTVEHAGFKKLIRTGITISVATRNAVDLRLEIGDLGQSVEVSGQAPLIARETSELGTNFTPKLMSDAPLFVAGNMRNPESFILLMPGVNGTQDNTSINGGSRRSKEVLLDGAAQTIPESGGVVADFGSVEQFGEFRLLTNSFAAEYGHTGGGIEIFVTKSGTNQLHGTVFDYLRHDKLAAAGWSINSRPGSRKGKIRQNEFGVAVGAPILIPKLYDGRNRSFVYFTFNGYRQNSGVSTQPTTIATTAMRQGDFSELVDSGGRPVLIYDPNTTQIVDGAMTRQPFGGNRIPQNRFSSVSTKILPLIPVTTSPGLVNNFLGLSKVDFARNQFSVKLDHAFSDRNRISGFINRQERNLFVEGPLPGALSAGMVDYQKPQNYRINHDYTFRPNLLNHITFGFTRQQQFFDNPLQGGGWPQKLGLKGVEEGPSNSFPVVTFTNGFTSFANTNGPKTRGSQINWTTHLRDDVSWIKGRHQFKFGFDFRRLRTFANPPDDFLVQGQFDYSNRQTALPGVSQATTGNALASFLLGVPDHAVVRINKANGDVRFGYQAGYFQDDFKVNKRLTLNLGLRYEVYLPRTDVNNQMTSFDPDLVNPAAGGLKGALAYAGEGQGHTNKPRFGEIDKKDWGPRVGVAYQITSKTVLRAGWGIYYASGNGNQGGFCLICNSGFDAKPERLSPDGVAPAFAWDNGFVPPPGFLPPPIIDPSFANGQSLYYISPRSGIAPRFQNWTINIQRELPGRFLVDVAYAGMLGRNLNLDVPLNQVDPKYLSQGNLLGRSITDPAVVAAGFRAPYAGFTGSLAQALRPYPQFLDLRDDYSAKGKSNYHSYQMKVERRSGGADLLMAYTFSKTLANGAWSQTAEAALAPQNAYDFGPEYGYQNYDRPHALNFVYSLDLPIGKGKKFLNPANPVLSRVVSGWTVSALHQYLSGDLLRINAPVNTLGAGALFTSRLRPNVTGQSMRTGIARTSLDPNDPGTRWLNRSGWDIPAPFTFGSASNYYGSVRNPPMLNENLSIVKRTTITETTNIEIRAEALNAFNRTLFGNINTNLTDSNFGRPTGVMANPRIIQMTLKFNF